MFDDNIKEFKEWLADNELQVRDTKEYGNGYLINLKQCPFSKEHTDGAYIFLSLNISLPGVIMIRARKTM